MGWVLSPAAKNDLGLILGYVERESGSPRVAHKLLDDFEQAFDRLVDAPRIGRVREELTGPEVRWRAVHRYLVVYEPHHKHIRILRVIHGMRHLPAMFE